MIDSDWRISPDSEWLKSPDSNTIKKRLSIQKEKFVTAVKIAKTKKKDLRNAIRRSKKHIRRGLIISKTISTVRDKRKQYARRANELVNKVKKKWF